MQDQTFPDYIVFLILGTFVLLSLCVVIVFFVLFHNKRVLQNKLQMESIKSENQKTLLKATINSQERERTRVGQELHDSVGAMLSAIKLSLKMAVTDPGEFESYSAEITSYLDETIQTVRNISHDLYPAGLKNFGMMGVLREYVNKLNNGNEMQFNLTSTGKNLRLDAERELMIYRIIQELIVNTIKHSRASQIDISLNWRAEQLDVKVSDNGIGFTTEQLQSEERGLGLYNISNRASVIDANVSFNNHKNGGACIDLYIPYQNNQAIEKEVKPHNSR